MKRLISEKYKHLLYKDEINEQFLLLKNMEIYRKSKTTLGVNCWSKNIYLQLEKEGITTDDFLTDDRLYLFETDNPKLPRLLATGSHSRRIHHKGRWLKDKEKRLAHKIIPFNPVSYNKLTLQPENRTT
ncbi:MAG: hypothetical protein PF570_06770 [Candidatus Cloacimonetes bacterium]|jgi:hypothetical protein|nr:hypothetical protein [Candidatus Cloacimonadota bacterium]